MSSWRSLITIVKVRYLSGWVSYRWHGQGAVPGSAALRGRTAPVLRPDNTPPPHAPTASSALAKTNKPIVLPKHSCQLPKTTRLYHIVNVLVINSSRCRYSLWTNHQTHTNAKQLWGGILNRHNVVWQPNSWYKNNKLVACTWDVWYPWLVADNIRGVKTRNKRGCSSDTRP